MKKENKMTLSQIFEETIGKMSNDPFCRVLISELKSRTEQELLANNQTINWDVGVCSCAGREEFLVKTEVIFAKIIGEAAKSENCSAYKKATQVAETLRLIFERETKEKYPKLEVLPYGFVKVTRVPRGDAPEWVRQAWVGLELPCHPIMGPCTSSDVVSGKEVPVRTGVCVPHDKALAILKTANQKAFEWWKDQGYPEEAPGENFLFCEDEVQIIIGVKRQAVHRFVGQDQLGVGAADNGLNIH